MLQFLFKPNKSIRVYMFFKYNSFKTLTFVTLIHFYDRQMAF